MKHLLIIGARGFGREIYWMAQNTAAFLNHAYDIKGFLDDKSDALDGLNGEFLPIIGTVEEYDVQPDDVFFCALGNPIYRKKYAEIIESKGGEFITLIDPLAIVNPNAIISPGCSIGPYVIVSDNVKIGKHTVIHSFCTLGHDVMVGDYVSMESYVFLGGYSRVGEMSVMHTKSSIIPHKSIGNNVEVGINSAVMRNIGNDCSLLGTPAVKIEI